MSASHAGTRIVWTPSPKFNTQQLVLVCRDCEDVLPHAATKRMARARHSCWVVEGGAA